MTNLAQLNKQRWDKCVITPSKVSAFNAVAAKLKAPDAVARYKKVEARTGVPWWFIAVVHEREASQRWDTQLGQGDPLNKKSVHVPAGRGPFSTWEDGAVDALTKCAPFAATNHDWSIGGALAMLEKYNGLGYATRGIPSPYIWAGTNQYTKGKFVGDGVFSATAVDKQLGCAGLLKTMNVFHDNVTGPVVATGTGGFSIWLSNYWHQHETLIIIGGIIAAIAIGAAVHLYRNKGK